MSLDAVHGRERGVTSSASAADARFEEQRGLLFGVAYRVLGSVGDAEDVVQEAWLRWSSADRDDVRDPRAFLVTTTTRLALNALRARRNRREQYVGPWLPEPLLTGVEGSDAAEHVLLEHDVSTALLVVLESLSPLERVVFVLHDLFGFDHAEVAGALAKSEVAVRQLASRARRHVRDRRPRFETTAEEHARVTSEFMRVATSGDVDGLLSVMAPDVVLFTDGGGALKAALRPIHGSGKSARFLAAISHDGPPDATSTVTELNGRPGVVIFTRGEPFATVDLDVEGGLITAIRIQLNPAKLRGVRPSGD